MKILLLTANYYPDIAANVHLAKDLAEDLAYYGCIVEIVTKMPDKKCLDNKFNYNYCGLEETIDNKIKIYRVKSIGNKSKSIFLRIIQESILTIKLLLKSFLIKDIDIIFAYSTPPTLGLIGILLSKIKNIPIVYNLQDIFPDSLINSGLIKKGIIIKLGKYIEKIIYNNCDKIVVISKQFKEILKTRGVEEEKIEVVYNWIDSQKIKDIPQKNNYLFDRYKLDRNNFYLLYSGNLGLTQNIELLIDVAKDLECYSDIRFLIVGDGVNKNKLIDYASKKGVQNIIFLPYQSHEEISYVYSLGDVGIIISKKNISKNSLPSKAWSIMAANRAVLASFDLDSELCEIIKSHNCGLCVDAENKNELIKAILELYNNKVQLREMSNNGRVFVTNYLDRKRATTKLYKLFKELIKKN